MEEIIAKIKKDEIKARTFEEKESIDSKWIEISGDNFKANGFIERPQSLENSYYFPLDDRPGGYDLSGGRTIEPSLNKNIAYDLEGAWVGKETKNLWPVNEYKKTLEFNGTNSYVLAEKPNSLGGAFTISLWGLVKVNKLSYFLSLNNGGSIGSNPIIYYNTNGRIGYYEGRNNYFGDLPLNTWGHITVVRTSTSFKAYLNGKFEAEFLESRPDITYSQINIGRNPYLEGEVKEVKIHNRVLSEEEIRSQYEGNYISEGLIVHYPLNEGEGSIAYDVSGGNNNGSIVNGNWKQKEIFYSTGSISSASGFNKVKHKFTAPKSTLGEDNFMNLPAGQYTISSYYKGEASSTPQHFDFVSNQAGSTAVSKDLMESNIPSIKETWRRGWLTARYANVPKAYPRITFNGTGENVTLSGMMIENKRFPSPYCKVSRGEGELAYNLHESIDLDWSADEFTIMYWKKFHGSSNDNDSTGNSGENLGNKISWSFDFSSKKFEFEGNQSSVIVSNWKYEWFFVVLRGGEGNIELNIYRHNSSSPIFTASIPNPADSPDYFVDDDYDLMLGAKTKGNPSNTYYRDMQILKYKLEDPTEYFNTKYRISESGISVGNMIEGVL